VKQTVYKSGSSLVVVVPSEFVEAIGVKTGDDVSVAVDYDAGTLTYQFSGQHQLTLTSVSKKSKKRV
jgi:antitoxin component of MazEF toxin-antitoxin module